MPHPEKVFVVLGDVSESASVTKVINATVRGNLAENAMLIVLPLTLGVDVLLQRLRDPHVSSELVACGEIQFLLYVWVL